MFTSVILPLLLITGVGLVFGCILGVAYKFLAVKSNEKTEAVQEALPGANCGACGFAGCAQYAAAISEKGAKTNLCPVGGEAVAHRLSEIMGSSYEKLERRKAFVACNGSRAHCRNVSEYQGVDSCAACNDMFLGRKDCKYGCLGLGDCVRACPFGAIRIEDGVAVVDQTACTGCGQCFSKCPKQLIKVTLENVRTFVACSNKDRGNLTRKLCTSGCIGCKRCEKACEHGAIRVDEFCAVIDRTLCVQCHACRDVCPTGAIVVVEPCGTIVANWEEDAG